MLEENIYTAPVSSLLSLCERTVAMCDCFDNEVLSSLPTRIKTKILHVACKRGTLSIEKLNALLTKDITDLDLSECTISDKHLRIIPRCAGLKKLNLNPGRHQRHLFTRTELINLLPNLTKLTRFYAKGSCEVNDKVLEILIQNCPYLCELDVGGCSLTDEAAKSISELKCLSSLNISNTKISDLGVSCIANGESRFKIEEIKLNNCPEISAKAIHTICKNCLQIKVLVFAGCKNFTGNCEQSLESLIERSKLTHITYTVY